MREGFALRCLRRLSRPRMLSDAPGGTTDTPAVCPSRPLVLRTDLSISLRPTADRDRTVSRRSEPSSRASLMGEQPNLGTYYSPRDETSRHRGAKPPRRCGLLGEISLLSRGSFYPLSDGPSTRNHRITKPDFRPCSTCMSRNQAPICLCTPRRDFQPRWELGASRYSLGGDRPSPNCPSDGGPLPGNGRWLEH